MEIATPEQPMQWFAMRDLKRHNAKEPAYRMLAGLGFEVYTPMTRRLTVKAGRRNWKEVPYMQDLLFVHAAREALDPVVAKTPTLQYRFLRKTFREPMTVPHEEMERFMQAVKSSSAPRYYRPEELTPAMDGRTVRIIGGPLNGCEGALLSLRGSRYKRILVELPDILTVAVEVQPEVIELLP